MIRTGRIAYSSILPFTILLISISSILQWCSLPIGNTTLWWCIQAIILYIFLKLKPKGYKIKSIKYFLIYLIFSALYGAFFMAESYWDWKMLISNLMVFSLPLATFVYSKPEVLSKTLRMWFKYAWIIFVILFPFLYSNAIGRFLVPFSFLSLFIVLLDKKYLYLTIIAYILTIALGYDSRSDLIKFTTTMLMGYALGSTIIEKKRDKILKAGFAVLFSTPFIFFTLGVTGVFNIFNMEEELGLEGKYQISHASGDTYSALQDTRTFLYVEEIASAIDNHYVIQGRTIARGYDSIAFGASMDEITGSKRGERGSCETSILNIFNYFGVIGVLVYFWIFFSASYVAVFKSRNRFVQIVGMYVAFRWLFAWIEDFSRFDLNYLFVWIMIGICFSPVFRGMSNLEVKMWVKSFTQK